MSSSLRHKTKFMLVLSMLSVILSLELTDFGPEDVQLVIDVNLKATSFAKCAECERSSMTIWSLKT